jgi:hypothetical protein
MYNRSWLKFLRHSKEAHHVREIFNGTYGLINEPEIQDLFKTTIIRLQDNTHCEHTRTSLENLKEDIEEEIETGNMRKKITPHIKTNGRPFSKDNTPKIEKVLLIIDKMKFELNRLEDLVESMIDKQEIKSL